MNALQATDDIRIRAALVLAEAGQLTRDRFQIEEGDAAEYGNVVHLIIDERDDTTEEEIRCEILEYLFVDRICYKLIDDICERLTGQRFKSSLELESYVAESMDPVISAAGDFVAHFIGMARVFVNDIHTLTTAVDDTDAGLRFWAANLICFYYCAHFLFAQPIQRRQLLTSMINVLNGAHITNLIRDVIHRIEHALTI